jgi:tetratricopeptide (TPR) repeat protein
LALVLSFAIVLTSCHPKGCDIEPNLGFTPQRRLIEALPSPFPELTDQERGRDWGRELLLGKAFAKEMDLYRAITCFKRAQFLIPRDKFDRLLEIQYDLFMAYYTGNKYQEAVEIFENSRLQDAPECFPATRELMIALYDAYMKIDQPERACRVLSYLSSFDSGTATNLELGTAITDADLCTISAIAPCSTACEPVNDFLSCYCCQAKSIKKAQMLNAVLPGAGYYYVGQKKAALTSFLINALFIAASYQLFDRGYIPAAIITTSLEMGWYFGGINGAGLEARYYNEMLFERLGRDVLVEQRLYPILMFQVGF